MNALKYHWWETSLLSQAVLRHVVSKDFISRSLCKGPVPRMKKSIALFHIKNFSCHVTLLLNFNMWITSRSYVGHIWIVLWVSGSSGSHLDCSVGQWVKWVNRRDPLSTLVLPTKAHAQFIAIFVM